MCQVPRSEARAQATARPSKPGGSSSGPAGVATVQWHTGGPPSGSNTKWLPSPVRNVVTWPASCAGARATTASTAARPRQACSAGRRIDGFLAVTAGEEAASPWHAHAAVRAADEVQHQATDVLAAERAAAHLLDLLRQVAGAPEQQPVDPLDHRLLFGAVAVARQADHVDADQPGAVALHQSERRRVVRHHRAGADHRQLADARELVHADHRAEDRAVADQGVAGDHRAVGQHAMVADRRVVADVTADQEQIVVADPGGAVPERRAAVDRHVFADAVAVADPQHAFGFALDLLVLRRLAEHGEREDLAVGADRGVALYRHVRMQPRAGTESHSATDDTVRADVDLVGQDGRRGNYGGGVDSHRSGLGSGVLGSRPVGAVARTRAHP